MNSVQDIWDAHICCGCGICAAVCPQQAIRHVIHENGCAGPAINENCVHCGRCKKVCPQEALLTGDTTPETAAIGPLLSCFTARARDEKMSDNGTSGGFVTALIRFLLETKAYDAAFLTDTHTYRDAPGTRRIQLVSELAATQKSRYVQVAHTDEIAYIVQHREERLILVGTPCYLRGFLKVVEQYGLDRAQYLLIGLFCDKTMTAHVWGYFDTIFAEGKLAAMHFRAKEQKGWPGDVKLIGQDEQVQFLDRAERVGVKEYFVPESCLYCTDKLNTSADLSVGDNYISGRKDARGSNTVLIRTERAAAVWEQAKEAFVYETCTPAQVVQSQHLERKEQNSQFLTYKREASTAKAYEQALRRMRLGEQRQYEAIHAEVQAKRRKQAALVHRLASGCKRFFKQKGHRK
ncbi:MAG: Coenzyme F420 hydrogenase/dehydrogenase, beta subunit C-terminal domain [Lachnospiraceae bacterium]|nr:Coenzyme F420 hydrogenase/dehydrogenase, beta subunit C-terminal domain [Lachnospiraceae bacterium]